VQVCEFAYILQPEEPRNKVPHLGALMTITRSHYSLLRIEVVGNYIPPVSALQEEHKCKITVSTIT